MVDRTIIQIPENTSFLQPTKFTFSFPTMPFMKYFCQSVIFPSVSTGAVPVEAPGFATMFRHGDTLVYDELVITVLVDEEMRVYEETYNWLKALTAPTKFSEYVKYYNSQNSPYHDGILTTNTNAHLPNIRIAYYNCHPVSLGNIQFNQADNADNVFLLDITLRYDYFEIDRL